MSAALTEKDSMLTFKNDAICLSGLSGTKLKCDIIGEYYRFWWHITSGGKAQNYKYLTGIIDLHAATGEVFIEDTGETVIGSAGHVIELKANDPNTRSLKVILVEENAECYKHLKNVIRRRWPDITFEKDEDVVAKLTSGIFLLNLNLQDALKVIEDVNLGNCIYFFDPLRSVEWNSIEQVAKKRITAYYQTATEFIIFLFTSDWFIGREDFSALPTNTEESSWQDGKLRTVEEADKLFGDKEWRSEILKSLDLDTRQHKFVEQYRLRLHKWFRYVLPLPFNPKSNQFFHLIICSNYEAGIKRTRDAYTAMTGNPKYSPNNRNAYDIFKELHPELVHGLKGNQRPEEWKLLWSVIKDHEEGLCDEKCRDFSGINSIRDRLNWLRKNEYIVEINIEKPWKNSPETFQLNWDRIINQLRISPPQALQPISPENARIRHLFDVMND